jgi:hypothetical protein
MFMASKINKRVATLCHDLSGVTEITQDELRQVIYKAVKPLGVRVDLKRDDLPKRAFAMGAFYEPWRTRQPVCIEIFVSNRTETLRISKKWVANTAFVLFQTLCHEFIHKYQYKHRRPDAVVWLETLDDGAEMDENQAYLAELDEIDAYAHDIALELMFYHPLDAMEEMRYMRSDRISSWWLYQEAFFGTNWRKIHNRLLKKVYQHLSQIWENGEQYSCSKRSSR